MRLTVLGSYDQAAKFLDNLNRLLLLLGLTAVLVGSGLVFLISYTFTRPLASLVEGVRALEHGDFQFWSSDPWADEVAESSQPSTECASSSPLVTSKPG